MYMLPTPTVSVEDTQNIIFDKGVSIITNLQKQGHKFSHHTYDLRWVHYSPFCLGLVINKNNHD